MRQIWKSFRALYFASLMMLIGSGLLSTYLALRLAADNVDGLWVGALMAANYFGLVLGGKIGHRLIARVGHIRAYSACAGIVGAAVLGHGLVDWLPAWLVLRTIVGLGMMCQYMVIESWLNEQADANQRGLVFSGYMIASYLGLVLGQLILVMHPGLGLELLMLVALCFALCLVPVALTRRLHPAPLHPAPLELRFFLSRVPLSLTTIAVAGLLIGSFYGLAPLYGTRMGLSTEQVGLFMGCCIIAGLLVQWPLGWLSDRYFGKYNTVLWFSLIYCAGHACLALFEDSRSGFFTGLFLIALGSGGIKPLVVSFVGDQFDQTNKHKAKLVYDAFYWTINFGSFFASLLAPLAYTEMITSVALGWLFFKDFPDGWTFVGVGILIASAAYISVRERAKNLPPNPKAA